MPLSAWSSRLTQKPPGQPNSASPSCASLVRLRVRFKSCEWLADHWAHVDKLGGRNRWGHVRQLDRISRELLARDLKYGMALNHLPSGRFAANGAWLAFRSWPTVPRPLHGPARAGCRDRHDQDPPPPAVRPGRAADPLGCERWKLHLAERWPWAIGWSAALARLRAIPLPT